MSQEQNLNILSFAVSLFTRLSYSIFSEDISNIIYINVFLYLSSEFLSVMWHHLPIRYRKMPIGVFQFVVVITSIFFSVFFKIFYISVVQSQLLAFWNFEKQ